MTVTNDGPVGLWEAAERELKEYQFVGDLREQPRWEIPEKMALQVALAGRFSQDKGTQHPTDVDGFLHDARDSDQGRRLRDSPGLRLSVRQRRPPARPAHPAAGAVRLGDQPAA